MRIYRNYPLAHKNGFHLRVVSKYFTKIKDVKDLKKLIRKGYLEQEKFYILGAGMNTIFTKDFDGIVVQIGIKGISIRRQTSKKIILDINAGEDWINLVKYTVKNNWGGIENLSYIPGTVGAAPVQNIAAYGQNFEDSFIGLNAIEIATGKSRYFTKRQCQLDYRTSIFKTTLKGKYIVTSVRLTLNKNPKVNLSYYSRVTSVETELKKIARPPYSVSDVSRVIAKIRKTKFPNWNKFGTLGSFFLNPVVTKAKLSEIQKSFPDIQFYPVEKLKYVTANSEVFKHEDHVKLPAGWLLDSAGWRGKRIGDVGTSPNQALVIINYGNATPDEILKFSQDMQKACSDKFGIKLSPEVNLL